MESTKSEYIDPHDRKITDEVKNDDDLYLQLANDIQAQKEENEKIRVKLAREISESGDALIKEVENKNIAEEETRLKLIDKIYHFSKEKFITKKESAELSISELKPYLILAEEYAKPWFYKMFKIIIEMLS